MRKDYLGNTVNVGDYFILANRGSTSAFLKIGRVVGWKKDRMFFVKNNNYGQPQVSYTTRLDDLVVIPDNIVPGKHIFAMEPIYLTETRSGAYV